jgi:hypothetical protein
VTIEKVLEEVHEDSEIQKYVVKVQEVTWPISDLTDYQKPVFYAGINLFNALSYNINIFRRYIRIVKLTLNEYVEAHSIYCVQEFMRNVKLS